MEYVMERLQLNFSTATCDTLNALEQDTDATSKAKVIRDAIGIYAWLVKQVKQGGEIQVVKPDSTTVQVVFPQLVKVKP